MKLGIGALGFGPKANVDLAKIQHAEKLGFDCAWTAEAYRGAAGKSWMAPLRAPREPDVF
jgi:alkanesulfonate monooxygenase SsuD/methylene tetrahydromethanopterin reductase-like flavin-dependent oxidoreductase (luciferase family)